MSVSSSAIMSSQVARTTTTTIVRMSAFEIQSEVEHKITAEQQADNLRGIIHRQLAPPRSLSRYEHLCSLPSAQKDSLTEAFLTGAIAGAAIGGVAGALTGPAAPLAAPIGAAGGALIGGITKTVIVYRMLGIDYSSWKDIQLQKTDEVVRLLFLNMEDWTGLVDPVSKELFQIPMQLPCGKQTPHVYDRSTVNKLISSGKLICPTCNTAFKASEVRASYATLSRMTTFCTRILENPSIKVQMTRAQIENFNLILGNTRKVSDTFFELEMTALNKKLKDKSITMNQYAARVAELNHCLSGDIISLAGH